MLKYILAVAVGAFTAGVSTLLFLDTRIDDKLVPYLTQNDANEIYLKKIDHIEQQAEWPDGKYVVLAHGDCPSGFVLARGFIGAIKFQDYSKLYLNEVQFGSSSITIHNNGNSGARANINISACVKNQ
ncbi:MAG: hypothetical protein Tsb0027_21950 [Wenzhouxiangellaceae bacterium]